MKEMRIVVGYSSSNPADLLGSIAFTAVCLSCKKLKPRELELMYLYQSRSNTVTKHPKWEQLTTIKVYFLLRS